MKITSEPFGLLPDGGQVTRYRLENGNNMIVDVLDHGAIITSVQVPDRNGNLADVVLGQKGMEQYVSNPGYLGAAVGRNCNRIAGAQTPISGNIYQLDKNDRENNLHGGKNGLSHRLFAAEARSAGRNVSLQLTHTMEDMSDGFPGNLAVCITYTVTDDNSLVITYRAVSDQNTVINLTNHSYFNLAGHSNGTIESQVMQLNAPFYLPNRPDGIPTGEILSVEGTPFDLREGKPLGEGIHSDFPQITQYGGYDHNLVLAGGGYRLVGKLSDPGSGRAMEVFTDQPGVQLYTSNMMAPGNNYKEGATYQLHQGVCLETQLFPDAVHMPWLASPFYAAGEEYTSTTAYRFSAE